jgi:hypothetical protein
VSASKPLTAYVAVFTRVDGSWNTVWHSDTLEEDYCPSGYVRISEWQAVEFAPMGRGEVVAKQVQVLDEMRAAVVDEFTNKLATIDARKRELLAITHEVSDEQG